MERDTWASIEPNQSYTKDSLGEPLPVLRFNVITLSRSELWALTPKNTDIGKTYDVWVRHLRTHRVCILKTGDTSHQDHSVRLQENEHSFRQVLVDNDTGHGRFSHKTCRLCDLTVCLVSRKSEFVVQVIGNEEDVWILKLDYNLLPAKGHPWRIRVTKIGSRALADFLTSFFTKITKK